MDDYEGIAYLIGGAIVIYLLYLLIVHIIIPGLLIALAITSGSGTLWGGFSAISNYSKSFKENMIDSNRTTTA